MHEGPPKLAFECASHHGFQRNEKLSHLSYVVNDFAIGAVVLNTAKARHLAAEPGQSCGSSTRNLFPQANLGLSQVQAFRSHEKATGC